MIRAFSSSLLRVIIVSNHLPFYKILSNFVHFCPNLQIFCPSLLFFNIFLPFSCPFSEKSNACTYFLEYALMILKLHLFQEIECTANAKNSMQIIFTTLTAASMQLNLKGDFPWKFIFLYKYLILCFV